eukprot:scaffold28_cov180-Chaetoceros_neogracile.AAC.5
MATNRPTFSSLTGLIDVFPKVNDISGLQAIMRKFVSMEGLKARPKKELKVRQMVRYLARLKEELKVVSRFEQAKVPPRYLIG